MITIQGDVAICTFVLNSFTIRNIFYNTIVLLILHFRAYEVDSKFFSLCSKLQISRIKLFISSWKLILLVSFKVRRRSLSKHTTRYKRISPSDSTTENTNF